MLVVVWFVLRVVVSLCRVLYDVYWWLFVMCCCLVCGGWRCRCLSVVVCRLLFGVACCLWLGVDCVCCVVLVLVGRCWLFVDWGVLLVVAWSRLCFVVRCALLSFVVRGVVFVACCASFVFYMRVPCCSLFVVLVCCLFVLCVFVRSSFLLFVVRC